MISKIMIKPKNSAKVKGISIKPAISPKLPAINKSVGKRGSPVKRYMVSLTNSNIYAITDVIINDARPLWHKANIKP